MKVAVLLALALSFGTGVVHAEDLVESRNVGKDAVLSTCLRIAPRPIGLDPDTEVPRYQFDFMWKATKGAPGQRLWSITVIPQPRGGPDDPMNKLKVVEAVAQDGILVVAYRWQLQVFVHAVSTDGTDKGLPPSPVMVLNEGLFPRPHVDAVKVRVEANGTVASVTLTGNLLRRVERDGAIQDIAADEVHLVHAVTARSVANSVWTISTAGEINRIRSGK